MHITPFDNKNIPIVDIDDSRVPLNYFNIVKLKRDQIFEFQVPGYETCIVPATGTVDVNIEGINYDNLGQRTIDVCPTHPTDQPVMLPLLQAKLKGLDHPIPVRDEVSLPVDRDVMP